MSESTLKALAILVGGALLVAWLLFIHPDYLADPRSLGVIIAAEVVVGAVCRYRQWFFGVMMLAFLWAGTAVPLQISWLQGRWLVLATGAVAGLAIYLKDRNHRFGVFHLVAFFCILSALVSALVSAYQEEAFLKAVSLMLLLVYGASGARLAIPVFHPEKFFRGLLRGCEALTYISALCYFLLRWQFFGNPNSLGAVSGVVLLPFLLWGLLAATTAVERRRLGFEVILAIALLLSSYARSAFVGAAFSCLGVCIASRQYRLVAKGLAAVVVLAVMVAALVPLAESVSRENDSDTLAKFLYKGKPDKGIMGSRKGPWQQTWAVVKDHPWFGSGFGTSLTGADLSNVRLVYTGTHIDTRVVREHGNSYLAISEWVGLLGLVPFLALIGLCMLNLGKVFSALRRTGDPLSPAIPVAGVLAAGLIHAAFEDWLFAVGYYLCVFFWVMAFALDDLVHEPAEVNSYARTMPSFRPQFAAMVSSQ